MFGCAYLQGQQADQRGETLSGHEANAVAGVAHPAQHRDHQQHNVGHDVHVQLLHDAWRHAGQGQPEGRAANSMEPNVFS